MNVSKIIGGAILLTLAASAAHAQSVSSTPSNAKPALNLSDARVSIGYSRAPAPNTDAPATNRTSLDHTFGPQPVTASVGYLCGLEPPSDRTPGPASTFGPISTFLGGKLTYAFK